MQLKLLPPGGIGGGLSTVAIPKAQLLPPVYSPPDPPRNKSLTYPNGETVTYYYDEAWHQSSMTSSIPSTTYVYSASYTALDQPSQISFGNGALQMNTYNNVMARLSNTQVIVGSALLNKSYQYDPATRSATRESTQTQRAGSST